MTSIVLETDLQYSQGEVRGYGLDKLHRDILESQISLTNKVLELHQIFF